MKKTVTWILVADHQHARVFANDGPGRGVDVVDDITLDTHLERSRDLDRHEPITGFSAKDGVRHGIEPRSDAHRKAGRRFLEDAVAALEAVEKKGGFDRLILVAPPRALGELRQMLPETLKQRVIGELDQDLTKTTARELATHLEGVLAV
ncbi:MAG: hypothetical protein TEF_18590 [Rhizobiales bacterium NRL2]|nr:MAG: hypothetical protein TEF_18590 [Rhizobiales bacterium NRL2]